MKDMEIYEGKNILLNAKIKYINIIQNSFLKVVIGFNNFSQDYEIECNDVNEAYVYLKKNHDLGYVEDYKYFYEHSECYLSLDPDPDVIMRSDKDGLVIICSSIERRLL